MSLMSAQFEQTSKGLRSSLALAACAFLALQNARAAAPDPEPPPAPEGVVASYTAKQCPFVFEVPAAARLVAPGYEDTKWPDGTSNLTADWTDGQISISMSCSPSSTLKIPADYLPEVCSERNPNLVAGSYCGAARRFEGAEVFQRLTLGDDNPQYQWLYFGAKPGAGKLVFSVSANGEPAKDADVRREIDVRAKAMFETVR